MEVTPLITNVYWSAVQCSQYELPSRLIDGNLATKWYEPLLGGDKTPEQRDNVWVVFVFPEKQRITHYNLYLVGDSLSRRDITSWRIQGGDDGETWTDLDVWEGYFIGRSSREYANGGFALAGNVTERVADGATVAVSQGARLVADGVVFAPCGVAAEGGEICITNGAVFEYGRDDIAVQSIYDADLVGDGTFVKQGSNTVNVIGRGALTGGIRVKSGTLAFPRALSPQWFRFTARKVYSATTLAQLSELMIYDAATNRVNLGITNVVSYSHT